MHRSTSARQLAAEPGSLARLARPWRLQSALFLLLGLLVSYGVQWLLIPPTKAGWW